MKKDQISVSNSVRPSNLHKEHALLLYSFLPSYTLYETPPCAYIGAMDFPEFAVYFLHTAVACIHSFLV